MTQHHHPSAEAPPRVDGSASAGRRPPPPRNPHPKPVRDLSHRHRDDVMAWATAREALRRADFALDTTRTTLT